MDHHATESHPEVKAECRHWAMREWVETDSTALDRAWYQPPAEAELRGSDDALTNKRRRFYYAKLRGSTQSHYEVAA